ncbi:Asp23/Gls24 family envelope stress response protein [Streptomyces sp. ISL-44]|nr:Asp23/Gls24 family envelope stress response protein [Streptomyces sp. ISL-44]
MSVEGQQAKAVLARATQAVPGVAYLSPGLRERVRRMIGQSADRTAGVRIFRDAAGSGWQVEVSVAVQAGHRADVVARAVRAAAVTGFAELEPGATPHVTVTVTAVV